MMFRIMFNLLLLVSVLCGIGAVGTWGVGYGVSAGIGVFVLGLVVVFFVGVFVGGRG